MAINRIIPALVVGSETLTLTQEKFLNSVQIGMLGFGTVGQGSAAILARNSAEIERRVGRSVVVSKAAVRDVAKAEKLGTGISITDDPSQVVSDPDIEIVCEMMGGEEPAFSLVCEAIKNKKHVVTANKALIATRGMELIDLAREHGVVLAFEPAVAGGIPVIKAIREGLAGNEIQWLAGIINGTGNFILSEMRDKQREFKDVLEEAQALGYAEADPTFDVEGIDAAHKLTILASIAFGIPLKFDAVHIEGISNITTDDVAYANELGYRIKHLGIAKRRTDGVELRVHPTLIPEKRLLANVDGVMNAVLVQSDAVGPTLYYGPGAGGEATGSSVVADIIDIVRTLQSDPADRVPTLAFQSESLNELPILAATEFESAYYIRLQAQDKPGVMAEISQIFGSSGISLEAILQKEPNVPPDSVDSSDVTVPVVLLSRKVNEGAIKKAIAAVDALPTITQPVSMIRVESLA